MSQLTFTLIKDIAEAEKAWKALTPAETIYDDWDFRFAFHRYHQKELFFIAGYDGAKLVGLLPLQYNEARGCLECFGSNYMEDNRVFTAPGYENSIPAFYDYSKTLGKPVVLEYIRGNDPFTTALSVQGYKYVLPLTFKTTDEYIESIFSGETKKKLVKRIKKVAEPGITVTENEFANIPLFLEWNVQAYGGAVAFQDRPNRNEIFTDLLTKPYATIKPRLLTFRVAGEIHAITMGLVYNGHTYCSVNRGFSPNADKNLREFVHLRKVEDALTQGCTLFDAFAGDYGWKERWGCQKIAQHEFYYPEKPAESTH